MVPELLDEVTKVIRYFMKEAAQVKSVPQPLVVVHFSLESKQGTPIHMRIDPGYPPLVNVSAEWVLGHLSDGTMDVVIDGIRRAASASHLYATPNLSNLRPDALEYMGKVRKFRKLAGEKFILPERHFHEEVTITLTCPISGEKITGTAPKNRTKELEYRLRLELTQRVMQDAVASELIDTIEAAREAQATPHIPAAVVSLTITPLGAHSALSYETHSTLP